MDDMDTVQEIMTTQAERLARERRVQADLERRVAVPSHRRCIECDVDIPQGRLVARPTAVLCIDCQSAAEQGTY